jgi:hypothetical protein
MHVVGMLAFDSATTLNTFHSFGRCTCLHVRTVVLGCTVFVLGKLW